MLLKYFENCYWSARQFVMCLTELEFSFVIQDGQMEEEEEEEDDNNLEECQEEDEG